MKKALHTVQRIFAVLLVTVVILLLAYNIYLFYERVVDGEEIPLVFGIGTAGVGSGSMEPTIREGDLIVIRRTGDYKDNDIITFYDPKRQEYVTHRIIGITPAGEYFTRGDANPGQDIGSVSPSQVRGEVVAVLPSIGKAAAFLRSPAGIFVICAFFVICYLIRRAIVCFQTGKESDTSHGSRS